MLHCCQVRTGLDPSRFVDLPATLSKCSFADRAEFDRTEAMLERTISKLRPIAVDREGFKCLCETAWLCWPRVWYLRKLATDGGPFPRQQDARAEGVVFGYPAGVKIFVGSHAWESEYHPAPSGEKLRRLVAALEAAGADDDDVCFLDYLSMPQPGRDDMDDSYFATTGAEQPLADRTPEEHSRFTFALWEMSR